MLRSLVVTTLAGVSIIHYDGLNKLLDENQDDSLMELLDEVTIKY